MSIQLCGLLEGLNIILVWFPGRSFLQHIRWPDRTIVCISQPTGQKRGKDEILDVAPMVLADLHAPCNFKGMFPSS